MDIKFCIKSKKRMEEFFFAFNGWLKIEKKIVMELPKKRMNGRPNIFTCLNIQ